MVGRIGWSLVILLCASSDGVAQGGPSFDCAKASTIAELAICSRPDLAEADRDMAAVYDALADRLSGPAREHLLKDQGRWIANRNTACADARQEVERCLTDRYTARTAELRVLGEGLYPFISAQAMFRTGKVGKITWKVDASWPQFDGATADFSAVNRSFAESAGKAADETVPDSTAAGDLRGEQLWSYEQGFRLARPSAVAVTVSVGFYGFTGGAHGDSGTIASLVDLRTGRFAAPVDVFAKDDAWLATLVPLVAADLRRQFSGGKPGFDDALQPDKLATVLRQAEHYRWGKGALDLVFNPDVVGPHVSGLFTVRIPYATLRPLFAADGPIGN